MGWGVASYNTWLYGRDMTTSTAQTITFDRAMNEATVFARRVESIRAQVIKADYVWDALGQDDLAEIALRDALKAQKVPCTRANVAAALDYVSEGK